MNTLRNLKWLLSLALALALIGVILMSTQITRAAGPWYVDPAGNDSNDCLTTGSACQTIAAAIGKASAGDTINVAAGTYTENVTVTKALNFVGVGAATTIVDGGGTGRIFNITSGAVTLQGLTLRHGNAGSGYGGAIQTYSPLTLNAVTVYTNTAYYGGGVYAVADVTLSNSRFEDNTATGPNINNDVRRGGGGLYVTGNLTVTQTDFVFNHTAGTGGGVSIRGNAVVNGGSFLRNATTYEPAGSGAAIGITGTLYMSGTQVISNTSGQAGGAIVVGEGVAGVGGHTTLINSLFQQNSSTQSSGGAFYTYGALTLINSQFISNTAKTYRGAINVKGDATISDSLFQGNSTQGYAGVMEVGGILVLTNSHFYTNTASTNSGAIYAGNSATVNSSRFEGNIAGTDSGGAIYTYSPITITASYFIGNKSNSSSGGALVTGGEAKISTSHFYSNTAATTGGAIDMQGGGTITSSEFISNTATTRGGAVFLNSAATLNNVLLQGNRTTQSGSGSDYGGGAVSNNYNDGTISDSTFTGNTSAGDGGGLNTAYGVMLLNNNTFTNNTAVNGGAVHNNNGGTLRVLNSTFSANKATTNGGGIYNTDASSSVGITSTYFYSNTANTNGGGVYVAAGSGSARVASALFAGNHAVTSGSAVYANANTQIYQSTIVSPTLATGQAIYVNGGTVDIQDNIIVRYATGLQRAAGTATADYNLFFGNTTNKTGTISGGTHDVLSDPLFVDSVGGNYRVNSGSPALIKGVNVGVPVDVVGDWRNFPSTLGAYEMPLVDPANNAYLSNLQLQTANLVPYFSAPYLNYTASVSREINSTVITPTASVSNASITVNGTPVTSGSPSGVINLIIGVNPITVVVTAPNNTTVQTYTVALTRRPWEGPFYVDQATGSDSNECETWGAGHACRSIGGAISKSTLAGTTIYIATGVYTENLVATLPLNFVGAGAESTIIDGNQANRVLNITGAYSAVALSDLTLRNGKITSGNGAGINAAGALTLTNVNVVGNTTNGGNGGGIYAAGVLSLTNTNVMSNTAAHATASVYGGGVFAANIARISGGVFRNNLANAASTTAAVYGGGAYVSNWLLTISGSQFISNTALGNINSANGASNMCYGGGLETDASGTIVNTDFISNTVKCGYDVRGGGLWAGNHIQIQGGSFEGNRTEGTSLSPYGAVYGGGLQAEATLVITGTRFIHNLGVSPSAYDAPQGGALGGAGGATITGALFQENTAKYGGAMYLRYTGATISNTQFINNTSNSIGGAIGQYAASITVYNSKFIGNSASANGGATFALSHSAIGSSNSKFVNTLFVNNTAGDGAVFFNRDSSSLSTIDFQYTTIAASTLQGSAVALRTGTPSSMNLKDSIVVNYPNALNADVSGRSTSDYNLFYNSALSSGLVTGTHDIGNTDPLFINPAQNEYHLSILSPAIGKGIAISGVTFDLDGKPRETPPTLGAYEGYLQLYDVDLSSLTLSSGTLNPTFTPTDTVYTARVPYSIGTLTLTPTTSSPAPTITVNSQVVVSGTESQSIPLLVGPNPITVTVIATDTVTTKTYRLTVSRTGADLSNLELSSGPLSPTFTRDTTSYTATVPNLVTSVTVKPTLADSTATITINGTPISSGASSGPIALSVGANPISIVVTAQDGTTIKTYTITVTRPPSSDANLINLALSNSTLTPAFATNTLDYVTTVPNGITAVTVTPTSREANAVIKVNNVIVASGASSNPIELAVGPNTITTFVTAQDGLVTQTYTVIVTRSAAMLNSAALANLVLSHGALTPVFAAGTINYTATVPFTVTEITATPTTGELTATVTVNGAPVTSGTPSGLISLTIGTNTITTIVTAPDGVTQRTYTVVVTRRPWEGPFYVDGQTGSDSNICDAWGSGRACKTIGGAIGKAPLAGATVYIASGTYLENLTVPFALNFVGAGSDSTVIDGNQANRVFNIIGATSAVSIADLTIQNGRITSGNGAGVLSAGPLTLTNVIVQRNTATAGSGGGVYASAALNLTQTTVQTNTTSSTGGGVYAGALAQLINSTVHNNTTSGSNGGGVYASAAITLTNVNVLTNTAPSGSGGGLYVINGKAAVYGSVFRGNGTAAVSGRNGGGLYVSNNSAIISRTQFIGNYAWAGAGLAVQTSQSSILSYVTDSQFIANRGAQDGGGMFFNDNPVQGTNLLFVGNSAPNGAAVYSVNNNNTTTNLKYVTIVSPTLGTTAAIFKAYGGSLNLQNSIVASYTTAINDQGGTTASDHNLFFNVTTVGADTNANSITSSDPAFFDPLGGNYHLQSNSPAIGKGVVLADVATDLDGQTRGTPPTVGAYEGSYANPNLSSLVLSQGTLTPAFSAATTSYTATVANNITSLTVTPATIDPLATITVNGSTVLSGTASNPIDLLVGTNRITTTVTGQNGVTIKQYIVTVTRAPSTNANLSDLVLSSGSLTPNFDPATLAYTATVVNDVVTVTVTPTPADATASIKVNGSSVNSGSASNAIALSVGANLITTTVTAQDGTTIKTYVVTVTRAPSSNANLSNLALSHGTLHPAFDATTTAYTSTAPYTLTSLTVMPTAADATASIMVNGTPVNSGTPSGAISLIVGENVLTTTLTAQDGSTIKTYVVTVTRIPPSDNADLSNLALSRGTLTPAFDAGTTAYTATVLYATTGISVTPTTPDETSAITVNSTPVNSGTPSGAINLIVGENILTTTVTSESGLVIKTYVITITREPASGNADLSQLALSHGTLSPAFDAATTSYTATVLYANTSITVAPTADDATSSITVNGTPVQSGAASNPIALSVGENFITMTVTAENGVTIKTYTVTITRLPPSSNANLSDLMLSSGPLSPAFAADTLNYTSTAPYTRTSLTVTPTVADTTATILVNGAPVTSGTPSGAINLSIGENTITTIVTAQDGLTTKTYTVTVTRAPASTNTDLSSLLLSHGTLNPVFDAATTHYTATVANAITSVTLTPTIADATATITVNGVPVQSGAASNAITLIVGANTITTTVTAQDNTTIKTYVVTVMRAPSSNADLGDLVLSHDTLHPAFDAATTSYTATVANAITSVTITPTLADATATITVNGLPVSSGTASGPINLLVGANTISTTVTAQDGVTIKTYVVTVTRDPSSNANLSGLVLSSGPLTPVFEAATFSYTATVANAITSVMITPTVADATATITVNGTSVQSGAASNPIALSVGANTITTTVTAEDGVTIQMYVVTVTRDPSSNANLSNLALSHGALHPAFGAATFSYTATVTNSVTSFTVTPTAADVTANITVNGTSVQSGAASGPIALIVGANTITTTVTAEDGVTVKTYVVTVTRDPSSNANLSSLILSRGTLNPAFGAATTSYTTTVAHGITSLTVTPTVADATATITVNGTPVQSGAASDPLALNVGDNTLTIVVTAQDGTTLKTYTITVTRAVSDNADLISLALSHGTLNPAFEAATTSYIATVANSVTSLTVTPVLSDTRATITVNGTPITSGSASQPINLAVGTNLITTTVTALDGTTTKTYIVTVTRAPSSNASLSDLVLSTGPLNPAFAFDTLGYTTSVTCGVTSLTLTPTVGDATATITVNGVPVTSGNASQSISLTVGANLIPIVVNAQDGTTSTTYTVTITRAPYRMFFPLIAKPAGLFLPLILRQS